MTTTPPVAFGDHIAFYSDITDPATRELAHAVDDPATDGSDVYVDLVVVGESTVRRAVPFYLNSGAQTGAAFKVLS